MKKISKRICIISHNQYSKEYLLRLVVISGDIIIDKSHTLKGRGYYISKDYLNTNNLVERIRKTLKVNPSICFLEELKQYAK